MRDPNDYILDWTEREAQEENESYESRYSDADELRDEEDRHDN